MKFTIEKIKDPTYKSLQGTYVSEIQRVDTPDPMTVRLTVTRASALLPLQRQQVYIVDSKFWQAHGDAYMENHAVGTGPYLLSNWKKDDEVDLDVNPGYWGKKPSIQHVIWRPIPDASTRVAALRTGATDLITNVPPQYAIQIEGSTKTRMASTRSNRQLFVAFNTLKPGPQDNKLVREACNYAIDVPAIVKSVLGGRGYPLNSPIPFGFFAVRSELQRLPLRPGQGERAAGEGGVIPTARASEITLNYPERSLQSRQGDRRGRRRLPEPDRDQNDGSGLGMDELFEPDQPTGRDAALRARLGRFAELRSRRGVHADVFRAKEVLATWHTPETDTSCFEDAARP